MPKRKMLFLSDSPSGPTGLGRITRDLMTRIQTHLGDTFEVASIGIGAPPSSALSWIQYQATYSNYVVTNLREIYEDFCPNGERCTLMCILNSAWCNWLANPELLPVGDLKSFLRKKPFDLWAYFPIDADGPNGELVTEIGDVFCGFDRALCYTKFGADAAEKTLRGRVFPEGRVSHLPHGIDRKVFYPRDKVEARKTFVNRLLGQDIAVQDGVVLLGAVATNSPRKDWYLAFETCRELLNRGVNIGLWCHTDSHTKHWNFKELIRMFGLKEIVLPTIGTMTDEQLAWAYSACDATIGIALGGGFEYPIYESIACGTPCIHVNYAGGAEFMEPQYKVNPVAFRGDGFYCFRRPVTLATDWADKIVDAVGTTPVLPDELDWDTLWPRWSKWFMDGVK